MAEYYSDTPVSAPVLGLGWQADADFNGIMWSTRYGFMFPDTQDGQPDPLTPPSRPPNSTNSG